MLKTIGTIVTALAYSLIDDRKYLLCWKLSILIDTHCCGVDIRNRAIFRLSLMLAMIQAAITLLGFNQSLQCLDISKLLQEQLCLCAFLTLFLPCSDLLKLLCCLMLQSFLLRPEQRLKKALLIGYDPALVINLLLIIRQSFPSYSLLFLLYLLGNEIPHMKLRPFSHQFLHRNKQRMQIGKLIRKGRVKLLGLNYQRLEVYIGSVEDIIDIFGQFSCLPFQLYDVFHDLNEGTENYNYNSNSIHY